MWVPLSTFNILSLVTYQKKKKSFSCDTYKLYIIIWDCEYFLHANKDINFVHSL